MTTLVFENTRCVLTVKFALVFPAGTVMLDGTVATEVLPLESATTAPPEGAAAVRVTVPVELFPPPTLVGLRVSELSVKLVGALTVSAALGVVPYVAEIVTVC